MTDAMTPTDLTPRQVLAKADRLRNIANRARTLSESMATERNGSVEIGRTTLYQHTAYPDDLVIIGAMRAALDMLAADHFAAADRMEARVSTIEEDRA